MIQFVSYADCGLGRLQQEGIGVMIPGGSIPIFVTALRLTGGIVST